jgi:tetratricopeptide (TPR) repeat protein
MPKGKNRKSGISGMSKEKLDLEDRIRNVASLYEIESFEGDPALWDQEELLLDAVEAEISLARGRLLHARFLLLLLQGKDTKFDHSSEALSLFNHAEEIYRRLGNDRGEAEVLFWIGVIDQVTRHDDKAALVSFRRARELATKTGDILLLSSVERHLGFSDIHSGRFDEARKHLEESVKLRREMGFEAGIAAGLVSLAELSIETGDLRHAQELLDEAEAMSAPQKAGIRTIVQQVRLQLKR